MEVLHLESAVFSRNRYFRIYMIKVPQKQIISEHLIKNLIQILY